MRYGDDLIEEVRARNDIVDVISGYVQLKKKGSQYFGLCPFHNEKTPSFSVSRQKQMYYCFGCHAGGNVFTFLMQYENLSFQESLEALAARAGITLPEREMSGREKEEHDRREMLLSIQKEAAKFYYAKLRTKEGADGLAYLRKRELSDETIRHFGLGFSGRTGNELYRYLRRKNFQDDLLRDSGLFRMDERQGGRDKFWNRVMFPIMDVRSRVIGFGGRVMGDGEPKYLNSPETEIFDKSRNLYALNIARKSRRKTIILCEGYMDVISMHQAGFDNAVASLGTSLTSGHCSLLKRYTDQVLLLYDSDNAGVNAALRAIPMLREAGIRTKVVHLEPFKDPDEFIKAKGAEAFSERLNAAENSFLFAVRMREREFDMADPQGKSDFLHAAAADILTLEDEVERDSYTATIAHQYGVSKEMMENLVKKQALRAVGRKPVSEPERLTGQRIRKEQADEKAQKLLIGWEASFPELIPILEEYLDADDFSDSFYRSLAMMVATQAKAGNVSPASILNHFEDQESQKRAAEIFNAPSLPEDPDERERALLDVVCRLRRDGIDRRLSDMNMTDLAPLQKLADDRRRLDELSSRGFPAEVRERIAGINRGSI